MRARRLKGAQVQTQKVQLFQGHRKGAALPTSKTTNLSYKRRRRPATSASGERREANTGDKLTRDIGVLMRRIESSPPLQMLPILKALPHSKNCLLRLKSKQPWLLPHDWGWRIVCTQKQRFPQRIRRHVRQFTVYLISCSEVLKSAEM